MARFAVFRVVLQQAATSVASVDYATVAGTAVEGEDYTPTSGTLTFQPGETEKEVRVPIRATEEVSAEQFQLALSNPVNLTLGRTPALAVIPAGDVVSELDGIYPQRNLGVLFYSGEKHPGGGGELSDTEWDVAPVPLMIGTDPYPGTMGQINYDLGGPVLLGGDGGIQLLSGWYMHYLVQDTGSSSVSQIIFINREVIPSDMSLDPATAAEFNTWWNAMGRMKLQLLDSDGVVVGEANMPYPTTDPDFAGDPNGGRVSSATNLPWPLTNPGAIVKFKIVPNLD